MIPHLDAPALEHGGDLAMARRLFPGAPQPFIDLSTGINPHPYPLPPLPSGVFARLPDGEAQMRLAGIAEFWLDKPVIAINTATYWWALRQNGITDRVYGFGSLLVEH